MNTYAKVAVSVVAIALAGCASPPPVATGPAASAYTASFAAPSGSARIYILPTQSKGLFSDMDGRADVLIFPEDSERGAELGSTTQGAFIAFDIAPGDYDLVAHGSDAFSRFTRLLTFEAGKVYFLRPTFFRSAKDVKSAADTGMGFDTVDPAVAEAEIRQMSMVKISAKGQDFLRHTYAAASPAPVAQPAAAPAPAAVAAPAPVDMTLEGKLKTLQRLRGEGLITQPEYDAKRKALLDAY